MIPEDFPQSNKLARPSGKQYSDDVESVKPLPIWDERRAMCFLLANELAGANRRLMVRAYLGCHVRRVNNYKLACQRQDNVKSLPFLFRWFFGSL